MKNVIPRILLQRTRARRTNSFIKDVAIDNNISWWNYIYKTIIEQPLRPYSQEIFIAALLLSGIAPLAKRGGGWVTKYVAHFPLSPQATLQDLMECHNYLLQPSYPKDSIRLNSPRPLQVCARGWRGGGLYPFIYIKTDAKNVKLKQLTLLYGTKKTKMPNLINKWGSLQLRISLA